MKKSTIIIFFMLILSINLYSQRSNHQVGMMLGAKFIKQTDAIAPSFGVNYEYKFSKTKPVLGVGMISDLTINDNMELTGGLAMFVHPTESMRVFLSPGVFYVNYGIAPNDPTLTYLQVKNEYGSQIRIAMQAGVEYEFQINSFYLSPFLKFELIENNYRAFLGIGASYKI